MSGTAGNGGSSTDAPDVAAFGRPGDSAPAYCSVGRSTRERVEEATR